METRPPLPAGAASVGESVGTGQPMPARDGDVRALIQVVSLMVKHRTPLVGPGGISLAAAVGLVLEHDSIARRLEGLERKIDPDNFHQKLRAAAEEKDPVAKFNAVSHLVDIANAERRTRTRDTMRAHLLMCLEVGALKPVLAALAEQIDAAFRIIGSVMIRNDVIAQAQAILSKEVTPFTCTKCAEPRYTQHDASSRDKIEWCNACRRLCYSCRVTDWAEQARNDAGDEPMARGRCAHLMTDNA